MHTVQSSLSSALRVTRNYHFWLVVVLFAIVVVLHYPQQLPFLDPGTASFLGLTRHAVERVLLLVPITYASFVFGIRGGIPSLLVACLIMLPRAIFISPAPADALFESTGIIIVGGIVNLWFYVHRRDITRRKMVEEMLTKIVDGASIPSFVINKQHKVTHWNTAIVSLSGIKREEIMGTGGQWRPFYTEKRPVMADLIVDEAPANEIESFYRGKCKKSLLIDGAYEAEDFFPALGEAGKWFHFAASPIADNSGKIIGAIETLQDVTEQKNAEENLRYYLQAITKAQEEERKRIALELHDSTAQNLIALLHQLENLLSDKMKMPVREAKALWRFHEQIRDTLQEVRRFSRDLRPSILDDLGLLPALEWVVGELKSEYGVGASLKVVGSERRLFPEAELLLFRIAQEALWNTAKHSQASKAEVKVKFDEHKIMLTISDNGIGFQLPEGIGSLPYTGKLGLAGMQERVRLLSGNLTLKSKLGKGTTVFVEAPI